MLLVADSRETGSIRQTSGEQRRARARRRLALFPPASSSNTLKVSPSGIESAVLGSCDGYGRRWRRVHTARAAVRGDAVATMDSIRRGSAAVNDTPQETSCRGTRGQTRSEIAALAGKNLACLRPHYQHTDLARMQYFFSLLPSPSPPISSTWSSYSAILSHSRSEYTELRTRYLISPDGGWVNDGASPSASPRIDQSVSMVGPALVEVQVNNPLGLDSGNPWSTWFDSLELRRTIRQDVKRT